MSDVKWAGICPVCGKLNHCEMLSVESGKVKNCWCFSMPEALDKSIQSNLAHDNKQCICRSCWEKTVSK